MSWFTKAFRSIGNAVRSGGTVLKKIPVVGRPLASVYNIGVAPVTFATSVASGANVSKAALANFQGQIRGIKELTPYVQTVVSFVPGVGSGVSGAMAAALAIADGKKLTDVLVEAAAHSVPGGPLAQGAFRAATSVMQGKAIDAGALAALPIPAEQKAALKQALTVVDKVRQGKKVDDVVLESALKQLPPEVSAAVQSGLAVGQAQKIQAAVKQVGVGGKAAPFLVHAGDHPVASVALAEGVAASDRLLAAYNGKAGPAEKAHAVATIQATKAAAATKGPHAVAAGNALTLLAKRAAAKRVAQRFEVDTKGCVRYRRAV
jgi:hypothetical protein